MIANYVKWEISQVIILKIALKITFGQLKFGNLGDQCLEINTNIVTVEDKLN